MTKFFIIEGGLVECRARAVDRTGTKHGPLALAAGDMLSDADGKVDVGFITHVDAPRYLCDGYWVYEVSYKPYLEGIEHRLGGCLTYSGRYGYAQNEVTGQEERRLAQPNPLPA